MICQGVRRDGSACACEAAPGLLYCYHHEAIARAAAPTPRHRLVELVDETFDDADWETRGTSCSDRAAMHATHRARFQAVREAA